MYSGVHSPKNVIGFIMKTHAQPSWLPNFIFRSKTKHSIKIFQRCDDIHALFCVRKTDAIKHFWRNIMLK